MSTNRKRQIGLLLLAIACFVPSASPVIVEVREYHGKQVMCTHSGLIGVAKSCGTEGYARVFTGVVRSSVDVGDTQKLLQLVPDEVFVGDSNDVTAIASQACLRNEIQPGDKWLFYLSWEPESASLILSYDSPSKPISEAEDDLSFLRSLQKSVNTGFLVGTIDRLGDGEDEVASPLADHKVIAKEVKTAARYSTVTNEKGHFEFELLAGTYNLTLSQEYGLTEVENFGSMRGGVPVEPHKCWQHDFGVKSIAAIKPNTDGIISGHLGSPDGKPFTVHPWVQLLSVDSELFTSAYVDAKGYFEAKDVKPGRYVVGLGIRPGTGYFSDVPTPVYYPGVRTKEEATVIELRANEKRTDVDFQLPPEDVLKPLGRAAPNH